MRQGTIILDKRTIVTGFVDTNGLGLEVGPSYSPIFPKSEGYNVRIMDHATKDALVAKYGTLGVSPESLNLIEDVDYVWRGESLRELVGSGVFFDYIVASHVIEHTTDPAGFINDCASVLAPNGVLCLVVPDKRFCFDRFRPLSSLGSVVSAHRHPSPRHPIDPFVDTQAYCSYMAGTEPTWSVETADDPRLMTRQWSDVRHTMEQVESSDEYVDIHRWTFTPSSFQLLILDLQGLGMMDLSLRDFHGTNQFEFYVALGHGDHPGSTGAPDSDRRLQLLLAVERELAEQFFTATTQLENAVAQLETKLSAVYGSHSWRATAPLRRVGALLRRT